MSWLIFGRYLCNTSVFNMLISIGTSCQGSSLVKIISKNNNNNVTFGKEDGSPLDKQGLI